MDTTELIPGEERRTGEERRSRRRRNKRLPAWPLLVVGGLLGLLIYAGTWAWQAARAELYGIQAETFIESWETQGFDAEEWQLVYDGLLHAAALSPENVRWHESLGRLQDRWVAMQGRKHPEASAHVEAGLAHYRNALALRPGFASGWLNLALLKGRGGQFDREFFSALQRSQQLSPSSPYILGRSATLALATWRLLPAETQTFQRQLWQESLDQPGLQQAIFTAAKQLDKTTLLCQVLAQPDLEACNG